MRKKIKKLYKGDMKENKIKVLKMEVKTNIDSLFYFVLPVCIDRAVMDAVPHIILCCQWFMKRH